MPINASNNPPNDVPKDLAELETVLTQLVAEHRRMLVLLDRQQSAMRLLNTADIEEANRLQNAARLRLAALDARRRALASALSRTYRVTGELTIARLAELFPQRRVDLMKLREELRGLLNQLSRHVTIGSRLAGALVGHLNTVLRLVAGAVERAGVYTRKGVPQVSRRIGMMEAVG
jgi:hypothetical protein